MTDAPGRVDGKSAPGFIDLERVIAGKNPRLLKLLPKFIVRYLKRVIHQDELNKSLNDHKDKVGLPFLEAILRDFGANIVIRGEQHLLKSDRIVVASNHPLGGLDGMALMYAVGKVRPDIVAPVNDFLMHLPNLKPLFIPVNKHGSNAENISVYDDTFASGRTILYFPAGLCSRKIKGEIIDLEWKKTFLSKAKKFNRDILPVHISGRNSDFFYNLANLRKFLGLKANIEMLYLVDEMYKQKDKDIVITFGEPVPIAVFDKRYRDGKWVALLREHIYKLKDNPSATFII
ncbi:MAG: 1-acyl-sn-glycerol-3-phosphate acyltransferase [Lentimicrobium sp.]|jgi:putative hemolysin|nr:1-acyl-sn-glycerol-3-phosphate acyltransferase [Lentimicrobium sp.]MCO5257032.1 1-acyl-sn-glycerol-3-phosphate acyltransferase [Lentimicrobium sp.]HPJ61365.1 1-acyl-sn-glycerol-3-phosphate acyltransferase [Lentimicrobium sp.]